MCIPQGHILHRVQYIVRKFIMYFDDRVLLMESAIQIKRTVHVFGRVSLTNSASIIFETASLPGVQRWRTVTEVEMFGKATRLDVTIFAGILTDTFCTRPCKWIQHWLLVLFTNGWS